MWDTHSTVLHYILKSTAVNYINFQSLHVHYFTDPAKYIRHVIVADIRYEYYELDV